MKIWIWIIIAVVVILVITWLLWLNSNMNMYGKVPDTFYIKKRGLSTKEFYNYHKGTSDATGKRFYRKATMIGIEKPYEMLSPFENITRKEYRQAYYDAMKGEVYDVLTDY